jgi:ribosome biogenesis GTPase
MRRWKGKNLDKLEKRGKIRKKSLKKTHAADLEEEFEISESKWDLGKTGFAARVVEVHKRYVFVSTEHVRGDINTRDVWLATIARKFLVAQRAERNFVAVGDRVLCVPADGNVPNESKDLPACVIQCLAPRSTQIARLDPHTPDRMHVIAANADQLLIVASLLKPKVKWGLIDRYLVLAERQGITPVIVLNKMDILFDEGTEAFEKEVAKMVGIYTGLGYKVLCVSASSDEAGKTEEIIELGQLLKDKITLLSGHSGVGKSTLVNLFDPEINQEVEPDENIFYKGRHTTTYASLIRLGTGGFVVDTPGIRSFTFPDFTSIELSHCFIEMRPLIGACKFRECRHMDEPECAVRRAVEAGEITEWRYKSYLAILLGASGREGRMRDISLDNETDEES